MADIGTRFLAEKDRPRWRREGLAAAGRRGGRNAILRTFVEVKRAATPGRRRGRLPRRPWRRRARQLLLTCPTTSRPTGPETITYSGISQLELREALRGFFEAGTKVIAFFDTCYSGDAVGTKALPPDIDVVAQELAAAENGIVVITSSTGTELSRRARI